MESLLTLPHVCHVPMLTLLDDQKGRPFSCTVVADPGRGWVVVTEQEGPAPGLARAPLALARAACQQFRIEPEHLVLLTRYAYNSNYENIYSLHYTHGSRDLFEGARFAGPSRRAVVPADVPALVAQLVAGEALAPQWYALTRAR